MLQINMADVVAVINSLVPYLVTAGVLLLPESLPSNARMIIVCRMDSTRITSLRLRCSFREPAPTSSEFSERRRTIPMQIVCMEGPSVFGPAQHVKRHTLAVVKSSCILGHGSKKRTFNGPEQVNAEACSFRSRMLRVNAPNPLTTDREARTCL